MNTNGDASGDLGTHGTEGLESLGSTGILDGVTALLGTSGALAFLVGLATQRVSNDMQAAENDNLLLGKSKESEGQGNNSSELGEHR
jgi:hypothetical protein